LAPKAGLSVDEAALPWGGRQQGGPPPGALAEVLRMAPLVTASVSAGLPGCALQRGNFRKGRSGIGKPRDDGRDRRTARSWRRRESGSSGCSPVVIAAGECSCDPAFNLDGVSTSTHFATPLIVVNGPTHQSQQHLRRLGLGFRSNATIGERLSLLIDQRRRGGRARSRCRRSVIPGVTRTA